jgi:hypothetical protein
MHPGKKIKAAGTNVQCLVCVCVCVCVCARARMYVCVCVCVQEGSVKPHASRSRQADHGGGTKFQKEVDSKNTP